MLSPYGHNRTLDYLASLVMLHWLEMRTVLREVAVEVMCAEQIRMTTAVHRDAGAPVLMEVILVILVTQGIRVIVVIMEIVEIMITGVTEAREMSAKMERDAANEMGPGHRGVTTVMMGICHLSCQWIDGSTHPCCIHQQSTTLWMATSTRL